MKNNIFGYVFLVFIIAIMAFAIYKVGSEKKKNTDASANNASSVMTKEKGTELTLGISNMDTINPIITIWFMNSPPLYGKNIVQFFQDIVSVRSESLLSD